MYFAHATFPQPPSGSGWIWVGIAAAPNHYVRSAFQCSREVSKGEKEPSSFSEMLDASFYITLTILPFDAKKVYVASQQPQIIMWDPRGSELASQQPQIIMRDPPLRSVQRWKRTFFIFRNARCFVLYNIEDSTLRREKSLCRIAATPNHYVRSAFQCSRRVSKGEKEDATVLWTLKGGFHIMIWSVLGNAYTKHDITIFAAVRKFEMLSLCGKRWTLLPKAKVFRTTPHQFVHGNE